MSFAGALALVQADAGNLDSLDSLAREALLEGEEEEALRHLLPAARQTGAALIWRWAGLLQRSLDEHESAIQSFARAATCAPNDVGIAHGQARVTLEAGLDAVDLFLRAQALAPNDGAIALGLAAARNATGEGENAANELMAMLARAPAWIAGHEQLSQLLATLGHKDQVTQSIEQAIARFPNEPRLWSCLFGIDMKREDYPLLKDDIERAASAGISATTLASYRAIVAAELDNERFPDALFATPPELDEQLALWRIRHLLRVNAVDEALPIIDRELSSPRAYAVWPYASIAWRLVGDERSRWLERESLFVQEFNLGAELPKLSELGAALRELHVARGEFVDQSVRGGTQTDGPLLCRIDPLMKRTRAAIVGAVETYRSRLPAIDHGHPLLAPRRDRRVRFSGSWSVKLRGGGRHSNHVHPQGWISSALYISLPEKAADEATDAGWFTLGEPQAGLRIDLAPWRKIEPKAGHLVLFPSWMWHGTIPFSQGERLTIAFDVRPPI